MACIWELHKTAYALNCAGTCNCNLQHDTYKAHLPKKNKKNREDCEPYDGKHIMYVLVESEIFVAKAKKNYRPKYNDNVMWMRLFIWLQWTKVKKFCSFYALFTYRYSLAGKSYVFKFLRKTSIPFNQKNFVMGSYQCQLLLYLLSIRITSLMYWNITLIFPKSHTYAYLCYGSIFSQHCSLTLKCHRYRASFRR